MGQLGPGCGQAIEQRARVRHGLVEELDEQIAGHIVVVRGDVALHLFPAESRHVRLSADPERFEPAQSARDEVVQRRRQDGQHRDQICRLPFAGHVGLAEADESMASHPARQPVRIVDGQRR